MPLEAHKQDIFFKYVVIKEGLITTVSSYVKLAKVRGQMYEAAQNVQCWNRKLDPG